MYATSAWEVHCNAVDGQGRSVMEKRSWAEQHAWMQRGEPSMQFFLHPPFLPQSLCKLVPLGGGARVRLVDGQEAPYSTPTEALLVWVRLMQLGLQRGAVRYDA